MRLRLPDELIGEVIQDKEEKEVLAVPMEGPLDPVLQEAVESQPIVSEAGKAQENDDGDDSAFPTPSPPQPPPSPPRRPKPMGFLIALGAGALVAIGAMLGGANGSVGATATPKPSASPGGTSTGGTIWE